MSDILKKLQSRFADANYLIPHDVVLVGLGAVGQGVGLSLVAIGHNLHAFDDDNVSDVNCIPQGYIIDQIGLSKTLAFSENAQNSFGISPTCYNTKYNGLVGEIMISAVDNMVGRKQIFEAFKANEEAKLFIDARMNPVEFQIYCVTKDSDRIQRYEETLFGDNEVQAQNCSFKASRHTNQMIHGCITSLVCNWVENKVSQVPICTVPFLYYHNTQILDLCTFQD